ncbi:uncharacterized protein F5147DRAFT_562829 [Suillus discolor]|uniref:Uncharacterized protein n=1 Tax=Suillus discolor TaxID=1912936 RepID=A0A9P7K1F3_9AGAM|nr:uncharacterized protein F5147DRAFT_562829 [Suillus discolor]KAG2121040.1 hypothetical protein F5147DRAFT_562829 [Suillus discolor]
MFPRQVLDILNADGTLMAFICTTLPDCICNTLEANLLAAFGKSNMLIDRKMFKEDEMAASEAGASGMVMKGDVLPFHCAHFTWYNRYTTPGDNAPTDVHPHNLRVARASCTNYSQFLPYPSREMVEHADLYRGMIANFGDLFEWIKNMICQCLPEEYEFLIQYVDLLPGKPGSPVASFLSLVVNVNVCTLAHRDGKDLIYCLVLPLGDFKCGELVLKEQGLVVGLYSGDFMVFLSRDTTHFNLDYEGRRASLVLHTDGEFANWKETRNHWRNNVHFSG